MARRGGSGGSGLVPPPPQHAAVPSLATSQELEAARRELNATRKLQAEILSGARAPEAALPPWPVSEASGAATYLACLHAAGQAKAGQGKAGKGKGDVEWTEGPAHLATLLRHEIAREKELMAIDAAKHHNAAAQLRAVQATYAQGMEDVARCAQCRKYGAEVNRVLQGAIRRTLEGVQGFAPPAAAGEKGDEGGGEEEEEEEEDYEEEDEEDEEEG